MTRHPLDDPRILQNLFYPRPARPGSGSSVTTTDGMIPVAEGVGLGYRLYARDRAFPLILYFHGNGEIVTDFDNIAFMYHMAGASLLVVDYRGYGWSTGEPLVSALLPDAEAVVRALPKVLEQAKIGDVPLFVKGRSLGSASAIHAAYTFPERFKGLIVESGFADMPSVLSRLGVPPGVMDKIDLPVANARKVQDIHLPLLVLHGVNDTLLPVVNGQRIYDASPAAQKTLVRIPGAGHNDLLSVGMEAYFSAIKVFIDAHYRG